MSLILCRTNTMIFDRLENYLTTAHEKPQPYSSEEKISTRILRKYGFYYELPEILNKELWFPHTASRWNRNKNKVIITSTSFGGINRRIEIWE